MVAAYQSQAQNSGTNGANAVVTKPAGTVEGDLLIAAGVTSGATIIPPAGWVEHPNSLGGQVPLWTKTAGPGEPATYTFTPSGGVLPYTGVVMVRVDGQTGIDAASGHSVPGTIVLPSVTSAGADRLLFQLMAKASASSSWTPPGGVTERFDSTANTVSGAGGDEIVGPGATGTRTWTPTDTTSGAVGYMLAVAPVVGPNEGTFAGAYDFSGTGFIGQAPGIASGGFAGGYAFDGSGFTGQAPVVPPAGGGRWTPGGRDRFTARRTPTNRRGRR